MKRKVYEEPTMQIVRLEQVPMLATSPNVGLQDYEIEEEKDW